jgi:malonate transporter and related proteins
MNDPVTTALLPVVLLVAVGALAGWRGWVPPSATKALSNLIFLVLGPPLLFRAMAQLNFSTFDARPVLVYFGASALLYALSMAWHRLTPAGVVSTMSALYGNLVMIGVPLVGLAYGTPGLQILLTLVSVHALILLTVSTVLMEVAMARAAADGAAGTPAQARGELAVAVLRSAVLHPVPIPIVLGLAWGALGGSLPRWLDQPMTVLGSAFGPMALVMVGISLAHTLATPQAVAHLRKALVFVAIKNLLHPLVVGLAAWALGLQGLALAIVVLAAAMPAGANAYLFAQRYDVLADVVTASVALSTLAALVTITGVVLALTRLAV